MRACVTLFGAPVVNVAPQHCGTPSGKMGLKLPSTGSASVEVMTPRASAGQSR